LWKIFWETISSKSEWLKENISKRAFYFGLSFNALLVIFYETVTFQTLNVIADYMRAIQVVAIALLGISLGGLLAYALKNRASANLFLKAALVFPGAVLVAFASMCIFPSNPWIYSIGLMLPVVVASLVISMAFSIAPSHLVYFYDLTGAAFGAILACISVPLIREEGSYLLLMAFGFGTAILFSLQEGIQKAQLHRKIAVVAIFLCLALIITNQAVDFINMIWLVRPTEDNSKIFAYWHGRRSDPEKMCTLRFSKGSLVERIDLIQQTKNRIPTFYNGYANDHISRSKVGDFKRDKRLAYGLVKDPEVLVIGTAAEGIVKTARGLGDGEVVGLEINPAIVKAMTKNKFIYNWSQKAYDNMELHVIDARSYFKQTKRQFGIISMMNTHRMRNMGYVGVPEYLHTMESMKDLLIHLKDEGWIVLEERDINDRAKLGIRRFILTAKAAIQEMFPGDDAANHFWIYSWYGRDVKTRSNFYTQIYIKKTPINEKDLNFIDTWHADIKSGSKIGAIPEFIPGRPTGSEIEKLLVAKDPDEVYDRAVYNMVPIVDDRPFPFDVTHERKHLWEIVTPTLILTLILGFVPVFVLLILNAIKGKSVSHMSRFMKTIFSMAAMGYFSLLGIGYLIVEVVLIQKFQMFIGMPVLTLATIIGTMLFFSGLGSYFSRNWSGGLQIAVLAGLILLGLGLLASNQFIVDRLIFLPIWIRTIILVFILLPLSFLMGAPFPNGMKIIRTYLGDRFGAAMFGVNGAFSAFATPVALALATIYGYKLAFLVGTAAYGVCLFLALILILQDRGIQKSLARNS